MIIATTERLVLRDLQERDAENILLLNSDPEVLKHVHDVPFANVEAARAWIVNTQLQLPLGIGRWAMGRSLQPPALRRWRSAHGLPPIARTLG